MVYNQNKHIRNLFKKITQPHLQNQQKLLGSFQILYLRLSRVDKFGGFYCDCQFCIHHHSEDKNDLQESKNITSIDCWFLEVAKIRARLRQNPDEYFLNIKDELQKIYIENKEDIYSILPMAFAVVREASKRTRNERHFDVQIIGGVVLHEGKIAEMKTGEGKTLVATLPASLNALTEKGVHIVTVNDYLANRDQVSMGQIYRFLGLSTGLIQEKMRDKERWRNYDADITYVTNSQLAFDYLRDNTALQLKTVVLKQFNYCIVDEVDAILIDEARTPLIVSTPAETCIDEFVVADELVKYLRINIDFNVDKKNNNIVLFRSGCHRIEKILDIDDIYDRNRPWIVYILNALRANTLYFSDVQYIVQNNKDVR